MRFIIFRLLPDNMRSQEINWFRVCGPEIKDYTIHPVDSSEAFACVIKQCVSEGYLCSGDIIYIQGQFYLYSGSEETFTCLGLSDSRVKEILNTFL